MNRKILGMFVCMLLITIPVLPVAGNESNSGFIWDIQTVDYTGDVGQYTSIALDSDDNPHISYYDNLNEDLKYAHYDGTWHKETVDSTGSVGQYTSIALDSDDNPHISYYDSSNRDLKYATVARPELEIGNITGGFGVSSTVENVGPIEADNVVWEIKYDGMFVFSPPGGVVKGGPVDIPSMTDVPISAKAIGFGGFVLPLNIIVSADAYNANPVNKTVPAKLLLFFVLI